MLLCCARQVGCIWMFGGDEFCLFHVCCCAHLSYCAVVIILSSESVSGPRQCLFGVKHIPSSSPNIIIQFVENCQSLVVYIFSIIIRGRHLYSSKSQINFCLISGMLILVFLSPALRPLYWFRAHACISYFQHIFLIAKKISNWGGGCWVIIWLSRSADQIM